MNINATFLPRQWTPELPPLAFMGGGNMASAIIGGLLRRGADAASIRVVDPSDEARDNLKRQYGVHAEPSAGAQTSDCRLVVWAVKPQVFAQAAQSARHFAPDALHLSVAAGIRSDSLRRWLASNRIVRAMPNTPALIGHGMTALFGCEAVNEADRQLIESVLSPTGELLWLTDESQLDAVTAVSGSGPAYVFYFMQAMIEAGKELGLNEDQARQLTLSTFAGASALALQSTETPEQLRARVTSKGGTTHAAVTEMEQHAVLTSVRAAVLAAHRRALELGDAFGAA